MGWNLQGEKYKLLPDNKDKDMKLVPIVVPPGQPAEVILTCFKKDYDGEGVPQWHMDNINYIEKEPLDDVNRREWSRKLTFTKKDAGIKNVSCHYKQLNQKRGTEFSQSITVQFKVYTGTLEECKVSQ